MRGRISILLALCLFVLTSSIWPTKITTPYPEKITVSQIVSAQTEQKRMHQRMHKFDHALTGFYAPAGAKIEVDVKVLAQSADNAMPYLVVGTPRREGDKRKEFKLKEGKNIVTPETGGLIYFRYVSDDYNPTGKVEISFGKGSQHKRAPHFIKGVTTDDEFRAMLVEYPTRDMMFSTPQAVIVIGSKWAEKYSAKTKKESWLATIDRILDIESDISGFDDNDPNPLHHRLAPGIRHLFAEAAPMQGAAMFATNWMTGYFNDFAMVRLLTDTINTNNWGVAHELGHHHQQPLYTHPALSEVTVNIYTLAVQRAFYDNYTRSTPEQWKRLQEGYFSKPTERRVYFANDKDLIAAVGNTPYEVNMGRLMMFEQLYFLFGDEFYKTLHRVVREDVAKGQNTNAQILYLLLKACEVTGYDLRDYFGQWGLYNGSVQNPEALRQSFEALDQFIEETGYGKPDFGIDLHLVTSENYKKLDFLPIKLKGKTTGGNTYKFMHNIRKQ